MRLALAVSALVVCSCAPAALGPPPPAPSAIHPLDAIPGDLDLVVRLDLKRIRDTLGVTAMQGITEQAIHGLRGEDSATDQLLLGALNQTDTLLVGFRPVNGLEGADSVFVLSGQFAKFDPHAVASNPPFQAPIDLGAAFRRYDRKSPPARSAPARIYTRGDDLIVSTSEAEIDSVERSLEQHRGAPPLEPAEKGAISAVARPRVVPSAWFDASPALERLAEHARRFELNADLTSAGVDATLALKFEDAATAKRLASALTDLRDSLSGAPGRLGKLATKTEVTSAAEFITLHLVVGRDELGEIVNCRGSACAW